MCSSGNAGLISEVCREKTTAGDLFTAFDISLEVQRRAKIAGIPGERHRELKDTIHDTLETYATHNGGEYSRTLMDVGAPEKAFVYHRQQDDPYTLYKPLDRSQFQSAASVTAAAVQQAVVVPTGAYRPDARVTLCVLAEHLRKIGAQPGNKVVVAASADQLTVYTKDKADAMTFANPAWNAEYTVDSYGNVRITKATLRLAFKEAKTGSNLYRFESDANEIRVFEWVDAAPVVPAPADPKSYDDVMSNFGSAVDGAVSPPLMSAWVGDPSIQKQISGGDFSGLN